MAELGLGAARAGLFDLRLEALLAVGALNRHNIGTASGVVPSEAFIVSM